MLKEKHRAFYDEIFPALDIYEDKRLNARRSSNIIMALLVVLYMVIAFFMLRHSFSQSTFINLLMLFSAFLWLSKLVKKRYIGKFKRDVLVNLFEREGILINHYAYANISGRHFSQSKLFKSAGSFSGSDLIKGRKDDFFFIVSELKAFIKRDNSTETIFEGIFLAADIPKKLTGSTTIYSKNFRYEYNDRVPSNKFETLNRKFEYFFNVEYSNFDDTSLLLMPAFMDRLIAFQKKHKRPFILKVVDSKVYLAINEHKDFFNISIDQRAYQQINLKILSEDADFFFDIINLIDAIE